MKDSFAKNEKNEEYSSGSESSEQERFGEDLVSAYKHVVNANENTQKEEKPIITPGS
jgi:hypothetical protein